MISRRPGALTGEPMRGTSSMTVYIVVGALVLVAAVTWLWTRRSGAGPSRSGERIERVDPREILFSLPTIYDTQPALDSPPADTAVKFQLHEDDWRQVELVSANDRTAVERELAEVRAFKQAHFKGVGWSSIFVRKERPDALMSRHIPLDSLLKVLTGGAKLEPLFMEAVGRPALVRGGFAIPLTDSLFAYGQASNGDLVSLCLSGSPDSKDQAAFRPILAFASAHDLLLVDWYRQELTVMRAPGH
jgi:hypothetical protein